MISASYEFENSYAKHVNRGVFFWNGSEDDISPDNPRRSVDGIIYELIGAEQIWSDAYDLKGIKVTIEIEEVTKQ